MPVPAPTSVRSSHRVPTGPVEVPAVGAVSFTTEILTSGTGDAAAGGLTATVPEVRP